MYKNQIGGLEQITQLVRAAEALAEPCTSGELLAMASVERRAGLGALKMLAVEGLVHARRGQKTQLVWARGPDPDPNARAPFDATQYAYLRKQLQIASADWVPTDALMQGAGFTLSDRHAVLGALKALVVCDRVSWQSEGKQVIVWQWIGSDGHEREFERGSEFQHALSIDAVLHDPDGNETVSLIDKKVADKFFFEESLGL